jgi:uncharacterized protein (TIGR03118 family)
VAGDLGGWGQLYRWGLGAKVAKRFVNDDRDGGKLEPWLGGLDGTPGGPDDLAPGRTARASDWLGGGTKRQGNVEKANMAIRCAQSAGGVGRSIAGFEPLERRQLFSTISVGASVSDSTEFKNVKLTADQLNVGVNVDVNLVDPRGITVAADGSLLVADQGSAKITRYTSVGTKSTISPQAITVLDASTSGTSPPSTVFINDALASLRYFPITSSSLTVSSQLLVPTTDGYISGWSNALPLTGTVVAVNRFGSALFSGGAIADVAGVPEMFVSDFKNNSIDVFSTGYSTVLVNGQFNDPTLAAGLSPYNVQAIAGGLFVAYAKQNAQKTGDVPGPGNGQVDVFNYNGNLLLRIAQGSALSSPWGIAKAPANFGRFSNDTLVANHGTGQIAAYNSHGQFRGFLLDSHGHSLKISGLWGLAFGSSVTGDSASLFYTAGPSSGQHGILGKLTVL